MQTKTLFKRGTALLAAAAMCTLIAVPVLAEGADDTIHIGSVSDLKQLAANCALDSWSEGKTVSLDTNIDLSGEDFELIPTFGGNFEGNGHTISGYSLADEYSPAAFFGWVQEGGTIQNLNVEGEICPDGDRSLVGGIVGHNYGRIINCCFSGAIEGLTQVGGIAAFNEESGRIENCSANGTVLARSSAGGIVGENEGAVIACTNGADVNTTLQPKESDDTLEDISQRFKSLIENGTLDSSDLTLDIGGIAGYSSGSITACTNNGSVGYEYVGYNIGGIAGRSDGFISLCDNHGTVQGRQDVGGIAGQAAPDLELNLSAGTIRQLADAFDEMQRLVDIASDTSEANSDTMHETMELLNDYLAKASDSANALEDGVSEFADEAADEAQRTADVMDETIRRMRIIKDEAQPAIDNMDGTLDKLSKILYQLAVESGVGALATGTLTAATGTARSSVSTLEDSLELLESGASMMTIELSPDASTVAKATTVAKQLSGLAQVLSALNSLDGLVNIKSGSTISQQQAAELSDVLKQQGYNEDQIYQTLLAYQKLYGDMGLTSQQATNVAGQLSEASSALSGSANTLGTLQALASGLNSASAAQSAANLAGSLSTLMDAIPDLKTSLNLAGVSLGIMTVDAAALGITMAQLGRLTHTLAESVDLAQPAIDDAEALLDYLDEQPDINIPRLDDETRAHGDELLSAFSGVTEQVAVLSDKAYDTSSDLNDQVRDISDQAAVISDLLIDALEKASDPDASNYFEDISAQSAADGAAGQILSSENDGKISGDLNVGGIAGAQSIESVFDPDDDMDELSLGGLNGVYESRAVLRECKNEGRVTAKKQNAGGIVGHASLGLIDKCFGYGMTESEEGEAVGGIAGLCSTSVKNCWAKCFLTGETYIGGIVGKSVDNDALGLSTCVENCRAMVEISGAKQFYGAIAGESTGDFDGNLFVANGLNGLDYRSIAGEAEPVSYEEMLEIENLPEEFKLLTLLFVTEDEEIIKKVSFEYGTSFGSDIWPETPQKENCYTQWDKTDLTNLTFDTIVTAEYIDHVQTLASSQTREDGRAVFYIEGSFTENDAVACTQQEGNAEAVLSATGGEDDENIEFWRLVVPNDGATAHTVRYLPTKGSAADVKVYQLSSDGSGWTELEVSTNGSYAAFNMEGGSAELLIYSEPDGLKIWMLAAAAVCIGAAALCCGLIGRRKKNGHGIQAEKDTPRT